MPRVLLVLSDQPLTIEDIAEAIRPVAARMASVQGTGPQLRVKGAGPATGPEVTVVGNTVRYSNGVPTLMLFLRPVEELSPDVLQAVEAADLSVSAQIVIVDGNPAWGLELCTDEFHIVSALAKHPAVAVVPVD